MKFVSLFSGIGGLDLGLERAGHECILQVEIDDYCRRILEKHWPDVRRIDDVKKVTADDCKGVDLIVGGFPCQPVSVAGRRKAQADPRWLWPEFARIISEVRPRYVLVENVPGLLTSAMGEVLGDLSTLGYDAEWGRVAAETVGAPHLRWRIFIMAHTPRIYGERSIAARDQRERSETSAGDGGARSKMADANIPRPQGRDERFRRSGERLAWSSGEPYTGDWSLEPRVGRVAHGVPSRVDRLRTLGNAVVPQVAECIGMGLADAMAERWHLRNTRGSCED